MSLDDEIKKAIEEVLRERGLIFARLGHNSHTGGNEWDPLYRGQAPSNEAIADIAERVRGVVNADATNVRNRMQRVYYAARMLHHDLDGTDRATLPFGLRLLLEKVDEAKKLETDEDGNATPMLADLVAEARAASTPKHKKRG